MDLSKIENDLFAAALRGGRRPERLPVAIRHSFHIEFAKVERSLGDPKRLQIGHTRGCPESTDHVDGSVRQQIDRLIRHLPELDRALVRLDIRHPAVGVVLTVHDDGERREFRQRRQGRIIAFTERSPQHAIVGRLVAAVSVDDGSAMRNGPVDCRDVESDVSQGKLEHRSSLRHLVRQRDERRRHRHGQNERPAVGGNRQDDDRRHGQAYGTGRRTRQPDERDARGDGDRQDRHHDEARGYAQAVFEAGQQH